MSLTEQWKNGELPSGDESHEWFSYYIKHKDGLIHSDSYWRGSWGIADRNSIEEVLAPVPSYEELQQLKSLLKECRRAFETYANEDETCGLEEENKYAKHILPRINTAIGESEE